MGHVQLVGHELVGVLAVGLAEVFVEEDAVDDCEDGVDAVDSEEGEVGEVAGGKDEFAEGEEEDEGHGDGADISGEAACLAAEVEEAEDEEAEADDVEEGLVDEGHGVVEIEDRSEDREGVAGGDAVDAVHEIVDVDDADADDERDDDNPPVVPVEDSELVEHEEHGGELYDEAEGVGQRVDVVGKTDDGHERETGEEPGIAEAEESGVEPDAEQEDDASAAQDDALVRAPQIRLVDDIEPLSHPEIRQLEPHQQYKYDCVSHLFLKLIIVLVKPCCARTGILSMPSADLIFALDAT